ncbi:MAG TPA: tetratricopeptide repeat protein [Alphaproteobacteria bacterium]|nr:tetratricopeptide repeat protein [Alphaproteobacteria bacterium]
MNRFFKLLLVSICVTLPGFSESNDTLDPMQEALKEAVGLLDGAFGHKQNIGQGVQLVKTLGLTLDSRALSFLGDLYFSGEGVEKDQALAAVFYKLAAQNGYGPAQFHLGILFKNGQGVPQSAMHSFYYLSLAAKNKKDLGDLCENAAQYRDQAYVLMTKEEKQEVLEKLNKLL